MENKYKNSTEEQVAARVALVDLLFCWPANGGADIDLYNVAAGMVARGITVRVFVLALEGSEGRGKVRPEELPFPVEVVRVLPQNRSHDGIAAAVRQAVDAWQPDLVFLMHGYALKPYVALALRHYPLVGRYYAHELMCGRNGLRYKDGQPCPHSILSHPDTCRTCAFDSLAPEIKSGAPRAWAEDYVIARAYDSGYYDLVRQSLDVMARIIVSNTALQHELGPHADKAVVIPGGVSLETMTEPHPARDTRHIIFMAGRVDDPLKGLQVLLDAAALLAQQRHDFHVLVTHFDSTFCGAGYSSTGWLSHQETLAQYHRAAICVVPSLWHEPFGLVAVEAMAAGIPVCASDTGGLRDIVVHGKTGFLFPPGDRAALAGHLAQLLDDASLREAMGAAGRSRALSRYSWDAIITQHYVPLIASLLSATKGDCT